MRHSIRLTDEELLFLDGHLLPEAQTVVDAAKARVAFKNENPALDPPIASFVANVVLEAQTTGVLRYQHGRINHCNIHNESAGYAVYKSGPRKGQQNYNKQLSYPGVDLVKRSVSIAGSAALGGCVDCINTALPHIRAALVGVEAQLPEQLQTPDEPTFTRYSHRKCVQCGWEGHEGEMGRLPAVLGGSYPGQCPSCDAKSLAFGPVVFTLVDGFTVVQNENSE